MRAAVIHRSALIGISSQTLASLPLPPSARSNNPTMPFSPPLLVALQTVTIPQSSVGY